MTDKLDFETLGKEVLDVLRKHGVVLELFNVTIAMSGAAFDVAAAAYPDRVHPEMIRKSGESDGIQWSIQVLRRRVIEDFPPDVVPTSPLDK